MQYDRRYSPWGSDMRVLKDEHGRCFAVLNPYRYPVEWSVALKADDPDCGVYVANPAGLSDCTGYREWVMENVEPPDWYMPEDMGSDMAYDMPKDMGPDMAYETMD